MVWVGFDVKEKKKQIENIEARIKDRIKGGYELDVPTGRAFLPSSESGRHPGFLRVGQKIVCSIIEQHDNEIVVSRKRYLESCAKEFFNNVTIGQYLNGTIVNIVKYGAFVDLGPVDALLHNDNVPGNYRIKLMDQIAVKVIQKDIGQQQISVSI